MSLKHFDVPQVASAIADRELTLVSPVDSMKKAVPAETAREVYEPTAAAYSAAGAAGRFRLNG